MKKIYPALTVMLLCFALVVPCMAGAQEEEQETAQDNTSRQTVKVKDTATVWINRIIAYVSQIGNLFGKTTGFRIGGTTGTAIAALAVVKLVHDKIPSWIKWALCLAGGAMAAGSGANIVQFIMRTLGV